MTESSRVAPSQSNARQGLDLAQLRDEPEWAQEEAW